MGEETQEVGAAKQCTLSCCRSVLNGEEGENAAVLAWERLEHAVGGCCKAGREVSAVD